MLSRECGSERSYRICFESIMFVRKLPYIIYRAYPTKGYLTDNRNFGYDTAAKSCLKVGDLLISHEGSIFYSQLENDVRSVDEIAKKLTTIFTGVRYEVLLEDATAFYAELAEKGFVECVEGIDAGKSSNYFSYVNYEPCILHAEINAPVEYNEVFAGEYSLTRVHVDISSRCNENCVHCYIPIACKRSMMDDDMFDKVLNQCVDMKIINITLSGGEPMLNPHLKSFLIKCGEANLSVNILSNLTCLSDELLDVIASNPLICVQTSVYAMDADVHDSITQHKGSFQKTISAIRELHKRNVPMQINCPIMKQNLHCYREVLEFAKSLNIEASSDYTLFGCYDSSGINLGCRITNANIENILDADDTKANVYDEAIRTINQKNVGDDEPICTVCKSSLCISNTGDVYPCEGWQRMVLGNLNAMTLRQIWEDSSLTKHLRDLKYRDFEECSVCRDRKYCTTCLIMNANENDRGDYMRVNPYMCELARIKRCVIEGKVGKVA